MPVKNRISWAAALFCAVGIFAAFISAGCASSNSQVRRLQTEKDELLATIRQQRDANRALQTEVASLEGRLDEAETTLAGGKPRTTVSRTLPVAAGNLSNPVASTAGSAKLQAAEDSLPWRPHRAATQPAASLPGLALLSRQDGRVQIDSETGAGIWTERIEFSGNTASLTPDSRGQLAELAKLLRKDPAKQYRVLVATAAERSGPRTQEAAAKSGRALAASRAQSVADYLDRHGIAEDRLAIASTGVRKLAPEEHGLTASAEDVKVYLIDPEQPVLGWLHSATLRR